ncbi:MAG: hypothetical protein KDK08_09665, partial [Rhizobiaceae bacterium]|nr:hypothetical protein [Rhizobiaceae bacterium]
LQFLEAPLSFHGKRTAMQIAKRVKARQTRREPRLHIGTAEDQSKNMLIEGETEISQVQRA